MKNNLELHKQITFAELVKHGIENGANIFNSMPDTWTLNGKSVTYENDNCYIIETHEGYKHFHKGEYLIATKGGLSILVNHNTHSPGGCPM